MVFVCILGRFSSFCTFYESQFRFVIISVFPCLLDLNRCFVSCWFRFWMLYIVINDWIWRNLLDFTFAFCRYIYFVAWGNAVPCSVASGRVVVWRFTAVSPASAHRRTLSIAYAWPRSRYFFTLFLLYHSFLLTCFFYSLTLLWNFNWVAMF